MKFGWSSRGALVVLLMLWAGVGHVLRAETCVTQSRMSSADREAIAAAGRAIVTKVIAGDADGVRALTFPEFAKDFDHIGYLVSSTAPKIKGASLNVDQVYILDASTLKLSSDGSSLGQFYCSLNQGTNEADFTIPGLPQGKYAFAIVQAFGGPAGPYRVAVLLRQQQSQWMLANLFPRPMSANGLDGVRYWTDAREFAARKQPMNAWLYYGEADQLLRPADFVSSTHLEKLRQERASAAPPVLSDGVSNDTPLVVKAANGAEFHLTGLGTAAAPDGQALDVAAHLKVESIGDPAGARTRNAAAMSALLTAYPELRKSFHGVWIYTEAAGQNPFPTEQPMSEIK